MLIYTLVSWVALIVSLFVASTIQIRFCLRMCCTCSRHFRILISLITNCEWANVWMSHKNIGNRIENGYCPGCWPFLYIVCNVWMSKYANCQWFEESINELIYHSPYLRWLYELETSTSTQCIRVWWALKLNIAIAYHFISFCLWRLLTS